MQTEGIQRGHMSMHARSLVARVLAGETEEMKQKVYAELVKSREVKDAKALEIYESLKGK
jgi:hydroxymethylglutaryl-CoA reductase